MTSVAPSRRALPIRPSFLEQIAPMWGVNAADWITDQRDSAWHTVSLVTGLLMLLIGGAMLIGGGYTSIQGIRVPLALLNFPVETEGVPPLIWWLLPIGCTFIQVIVKHIPQMKPLWRPSMVYDGATTGLYVATGIIRLLSSYEHEMSVFYIGGASALIGLLIAVGAEQVLLAGCCLIQAGLRR